MADLETLIKLGKQAGDSGKLDTALVLLSAAASKQPNHPLPWFHLAGIYVKTGLHDKAALCYHKAAEVAKDAILSSASIIRNSAIENCALSCEKALPFEWLPAAADEKLSSSWAIALQTAVGLTTRGKREAISGTSVSVLTLGDLGLEGIALAAAASKGSLASAVANADQPSSSEGEPVPICHVTIVPSNELTGTLAAQVAKANGLSSTCLKIAPSDKGIPEGSWDVVALPSIVAPALTLGSLAKKLAQASPGINPNTILCPHSVSLWGMLVESTDLAALNEVLVPDVKLLSGVDLQAANEVLRRHRRPVQVDRFACKQLSAPTQLVTISTADVLQEQLQSGSTSQKLPVFKACPEISVTCTGTVTGLVCWTVYDLGGGVEVSYGPNIVAQKEAPVPSVLEPHKWQYVSYCMSTLEVQTHETVAASISIRGDDWEVALSRATTVMEVPETSPTILPYHMSMLNDSPRTQAYCKGIQGAVAKMMESAKDGADDEPETPVVLDVGTGTGFLAVMAAQAGAPLVIGVEREPALAAVARSVIAANGVAENVVVVEASSNSLVIGKDLPQRAKLVTHEIFGTDPLSERILPTLRYVQEHLLDLDGTLMPCRFRVIGCLASASPLLAPYTHNKYTYGLGDQPETLDTSVLLPWRPRKLEVDVALVPDVFLLTEPTTLMDFDLSMRPLSLEGSATVQLQLMPPQCLQDWLVQSMGRPEIEGSGNRAEVSAGILHADCIIYWFEADCGEGGILSTAPGQTMPAGHWVQNVEILSETASCQSSEGACSANRSTPSSQQLHAVSKGDCKGASPGEKENVKQPVGDPNQAVDGYSEHVCDHNHSNLSEVSTCAISRNVSTKNSTVELQVHFALDRVKVSLKH